MKGERNTAMGRKTDYRLADPSVPANGSQNTTLTLALRLVRKYGVSPPSARQLMADFDISRPTAFRWRAAFIESLPYSERVEFEKTRDAELTAKMVRVRRGGNANDH
jgi:hypothetical protein